MAYWLYKSEPSTWSWEQQIAAGAAGTHWNGVRNHVAKKHLMAMEVGERGFFYHSNEGKAVVGIVEVCGLAHPDSTADDPRWECVDIRAVMDLPNPVTLDVCKSEPRLKDMVLVTNSRLSVQPVGEAEFAAICEMGGLDVAAGAGTGKR